MCAKSGAYLWLYVRLCFLYHQQYLTGAHSVTAAAMRAHGKSAAVQRQACVLLRNIISQHENKECVHFYFLFYNMSEYLTNLII